MVSVLGMYRENQNLFNGLTLPAEYAAQKPNLINQIILQCTCFEILYPDPEFLQTAIGIWSETQQNVWYKYMRTLTLQYNPIHNYDRTESETIERTGEGTSTRTNTGTQAINKTGNDQNLVSAFNQTTPDTYSPHSKTVYGSIDQRVDNLTDSVESEGSNTETKTSTISGNIGVTTTQQMIQQEREILDATLVQYIVDDFKRKFCLLVY